MLIIFGNIAECYLKLRLKERHESTLSWDVFSLVSMNEKSNQAYFVAEDAKQVPIMLTACSP
jgi:hypothetical protein